MTASTRYLEAVRALLEELAPRIDDEVETLAGWVADCIDRGGLVFVTGTGHSHMAAEEVFYRAGGLTAVCPLLEPSLLLDGGAVKSTALERLPGYGRIIVDDAGIGPDDLLIVVSNSGRNAVPIDIALRARELGCTVTAVGSVRHAERVASRHPSSQLLKDVVDLFIDTGVPYGDATVAIEGLSAPVGPVSTIACVTLLNAAMARAAERLAAAGRPPSVFASANLAEGSSMHHEALVRARARIRAL